MNNKKNKKKMVVFAGPSGSGKDTIMKKVMEDSERIIKLVTATTRKKRLGEIEGKMYYFLSKKEFLKKIKNGLIPEHNIHAGNYYGIYLPDLKKKILTNKIIFVQTQLIGAKFLAENYGALLLFFTANSLEVLKERIKNRSNLSKKEIQERLKLAKIEIEKEAKFYDYIINNKEDQLNETIKKVLKILEKENIKI